MHPILMFGSQYASFLKNIGIFYNIPTIVFKNFTNTLFSLDSANRTLHYQRGPKTWIFS